jgi:hypothetical protein
LSRNHGLHHRNRTGRTICEQASIGYYAIGGLETPFKCPALTIAPRSGLSACLQCDSNALSNDVTNQCDCGAGFYQDDSVGNTSHPLDFSSADLRCLKCPSGADCTNSGTKYTTLATVSGYWRAINNDTINTGALSYYRCRVAVYCEGGVDPETQCLGNRAGPLCAFCKAGYQETSDRRCGACPSQDNKSPKNIAYLTLLSLVIIIVLFLAFALLARSDRTLLDDYFSPEFARRRTRTPSMANMDQIASVYATKSSPSANHPTVNTLEAHATTNSASSQTLGTMHVEAARQHRLTLASRANNTLFAPHDPDGDARRAAEARSRRSCWRSLWSLYQRIVLTTENNYRIRRITATQQLKIMIGFFQIATTLDSGLDIPWPGILIAFLFVPASSLIDSHVVVM